MFPNARTLRGLGKVEFELRNYLEAFHYLEAARTSEVRPLSAELRDEVGGLIERARDHLGQLTIDVKPDTSRIALDGAPVAQGPHAELVLAEGRHVLELSAAGRLSERRQLVVEPRAQLQLALELRSAELVSALQPPAAPVQKDVPPHRRWWVWTVSGVALAGAVTATVLLATRDHDSEKPSDFAGSAWVVQQP
ncbi:MAG TPA: hypothetical protein VFX59_30355 [Polyangiales bacterium]|nr:hypothetical protein [Polyangiales bacterium]